jgi:hypothetical protein
MRALLGWILSAGAALGAPLDTQDAFDGYTQGKTIYFGYNDGRGVTAAETYLPGNRVRWFTRDGTCIEGEWYAAGGEICFTYENNQTPQCWVTTLEENGLVATLRTETGLSRVLEMDPGDAEFQCLGPQIGV